MSSTQPTIQMTIRSVPMETVTSFRVGAAARGMSQAEYLQRLVELHRRIIDRKTKPAMDFLSELGLQEVRA